MATAEPQPVGVVVFDDPQTCRGGWAACDQGVNRVDGLEELREGVVWWTNALPDRLASLSEHWRRTVVVYGDDYFGIPQSRILADLVGPLPLDRLACGRAWELLEFFRAVAARVWSLCRDTPSVQNRRFRLIGATLADDMAHVTPAFRPLPADEPGLIEAAQSKRRPAHVAFPRDTDRPVVLLASRRFDQLCESAGTPCAVGEWRLLTADELNELQAAGFPFGDAPYVLETILSERTPASALFGVAGPRPVQVWLSQVELALAKRLFGSLEVHRGFIATSFWVPPGVLDFAAPAERPSTALQELADTFVLDAIRSSTTRLSPPRTVWSPVPACASERPSWNGFWLDAATRSTQLVKAAKLEDRGYRILSYDRTQIVIDDPSSRSLDEIRRDFALVALR